MRWALAVGLLVALAVLAGCTGTGEDADPAEEAPEEALDASTIEPPTWSIGDHWTWTTDLQDEVTYVVTGEAGGDWIVDTTNPGVAFFDARFDVSTLGPVRKADLAGSQNDTRVVFFDWPLEENKTWTTTWDGVEREITVDRVEDGTAHLTARQDGRVAVEYTYDSDRRSFGQLVFLDENGTATFAMQPRGSGSGFGQPALRWQLANPVDEAGTFGAQPVSWGFDFEVEEGTTDIWLDWTIDCPSGSYTFGFGGNGSGYDDSNACPAQTQETGAVVEDPNPGTYSGGFTGASPEEEGTFSATIYVRTLQEVPVAEG